MIYSFKNLSISVLLYTLLVSLCSLFSVTILSAQSIPSSFRRYTVEDGLENNIVFSAAQDRTGMMWFATATGLSRFDGNHFKYYPLPLRDKPMAKYAQVQFIVTDKHKEVWTIAGASLFHYSYENDRIQEVTEVSDWLSKSNSISCLGLANDSSKLLLGLNNGFCLYDPKTNRLLNAVDFSSFVRSIYQDASGIIWVGTNKGLFLFVQDGNQLVEYKHLMPAFNEFSEVGISGISNDQQGRYWIVTARGDIFILRRDIARVTNFLLTSKKSIRFTVKDVLHHKKEGVAYLALDGGGILVVDAELRIKDQLVSNPDEPFSISNNAVYDMFLDSYGRFWIVTYGGGVNVASGAESPFESFVHQQNKLNSLPNNAAKAVVEDTDSVIWFGTRSGISRYVPSTQQWTHLDTRTVRSGYVSDNILCMAATPSDIWAGTYGGGLLRINRRTNAIRLYAQTPGDTNTIGTDYVYAITTDALGRVWTGGIRGALSYYDPKTNIFHRYDTPFSSINSIIQHSTGNMVLATERGVFMLDDKRWVSVNKQLEGEKVLYLKEDDRGNIWSGTLGGGLYMISADRSITRQYTTKDGLISDVVGALMIDSSKRIWVGTSKGVSLLSITTGLITNFTRSDGLSGSQINYGAVCKLKSGSLIFGTTNGFTRINPVNLDRLSFEPRIVLTGLTVNNKLLTAQMSGTILPKQIDLLDGISLRYDENTVRFDFVNVSPSIAGKHIYSWKLEGYESAWSKPTTQSYAEYVKLPSGNYKLVIKAFSKGQPDKFAIRSILIQISPAWWATKWAFIGYSLIALGALLGVVHYYKIRTARKKFAERLRINIALSHEIRTPLTLIKEPLNAILRSGTLIEADQTHLLLAKKNVDTLEKIISQFIDYQRAGAQSFPLDLQLGWVGKLIDQSVDAFRPLYREKDVSIDCTYQIDPIIIPLDADKLEKAIVNLLANALKYTPSGGQVQLSVGAKGKSIQIVISDTGIGIPTDQQKFVFAGYFRASNAVNLKETGSGVGLMVVKELIEKQGGHIDFRSKESVGTTFTITLPINNPLFDDRQPTDATMLVPANQEIETVEGIASKPQKILVVEDNDDLRLYLQDVLSKQGYFVHAESNGRTALNYLNGSIVNLVITDVIMPELNGFQLCAAMRKDMRTCHIPVIMLTAIHDREYLLEGYKSGADDFVRKPFDLTYILTRIENLVFNRTRFQAKILSVFTEEPALIEADNELGWLKKTTELIVEHLSDPDFSVEKLSLLMAMSRPVLFRKFKAIAGQSPQQFILQVRLRRAVELLQSGRFNINEVAYECGFSDPKYFGKVFKKFFGTSPSEFKQAK